MRIGILTLQGATNYGAVLQVLALREYLVRCGHEVDVIDYFTPEVYGFYDYHVFSKPVSARSIVSKTLRRRRNEREFKAFEAFRQEHLSFSARCETRDDFRTVCESYDAIICGSDQVWNPKANGGHNEEYYLGALDGSRVRKVAYAQASVTSTARKVSKAISPAGSWAIAESLFARRRRLGLSLHCAINPLGG